MADTVQTVSDAVKQRFPELTNAQSVAFLERLRQEIYAHIPELTRNSTTVNVISGTKEYALSETFTQVELAHLGSTTIYPTSVEIMNKAEPSWRSAASGTPGYIYMTTGSDSATKIGLHPTPSANGTLTVYGSQRSSTAWTTSNYGTEQIPASLPNSQLFIAGASYKAALELKPSVAEIYRNEYAFELELAKSYVRTRNEGLKAPPIQNAR